MRTGQSQGGGGVGTGREGGDRQRAWHLCWGATGGWKAVCEARERPGAGSRVWDRFEGPGWGWVCLVLKTITQAGCPLQDVLESARWAAKREVSVKQDVDTRSVPGEEPSG